MDVRASVGKREVETAKLDDVAEDIEETIEEVTDAGVEGTETVPEAIKLFPMLVKKEHCEDGGAGWAGGVTGWPWKNLELPYTPIGSPLSPLQLSNTPGA